VPDIRNSKVANIAEELRTFGVDVHIADPLADPAECKEEYGLELRPFAELPRADAVILAVSHEEYRKGGWPLVARCLKAEGGLVMDIKACLDRNNAPSNIRHWRM
jgi:UDP-N-acetyl-D-galactosamine dehydrogenase